MPALSLSLQFARFAEAATHRAALPPVGLDPQVQHRGLRATIPHMWAAAGSVDLIGSPLAGMGATPATIRRPPPLIGEHTAEVLGELGYDAARIASLQEQAII